MDILPLLNIVNLKSLSLKSTTLINVDSIKHLVKLEKLDKSWNFYSDISFLSWLNNLKELNLTRNDIKNKLNMDLTVLLYKSGYPPEWDEEVFEKIMEQAENFKIYSFD